jgi:hypothetical protein
MNSKHTPPRSKKSSARKKREESMKALALISPRLETLEEVSVRIPNVSVPRAAAIALAAEPMIRKLMKQLREEHPSFDIRLVDDLRAIALATWHLHVAPKPEGAEDRVKLLVTEGAPLKHTLMLQAELLADRNLVGAEPLAAIRAGRGNLDLANDLVALSQIFRSNWDAIKTKVAIVEAELDRAAELGTSLLQALGERDVTTAEMTEQDRAADTRFRAFTLLVRTYDEVRTAIRYLRRKEGDADVIAPSLYANRFRRRSSDPAPEHAGAPAPAPDAAPAPVIDPVT